jgi:hypothetical protein
MSEPRQAAPRQVDRRRFLAMSGGALVAAARGRTPPEQGSDSPPTSVRERQRASGPATPTSQSSTRSPIATTPAPRLPEVQ